MTDEEVPAAEDLDVLLVVMREQVDAVGRFVEAFAAVNPVDTSPVERARLRTVHDLLARALDQFS